ncbi:MAG: glycerophosphodiester phosphodiesterase family protein [Pirellulaceae bacterium]|nr:glycerophosphodiester phosphodiesterase family protein [Pirellulaceae bacterium]
MKCRLVFVLVAVSVLGIFDHAVALEGLIWRQTDELMAAEAFQAAAADAKYVYAISSRTVAKYDRLTKREVATSRGDAAHLNSGFLWKGKLLCAHSNFPRLPEQSEIKSLDLNSMQLSTFHQFLQPPGSLTWVVRHAGHWWCNFAHYGARNSETLLIKFDDDWSEKERWTYPIALIRQLGRFSLSGGIWRNEQLIVTGHDRNEFYQLKLPKSGDVLQWIGTQEIPFTGQGFAQDPLTGGLIGINRAKRCVVFAEAEDKSTQTGVRMPDRGICAHRGASDTHPENTLAAFREAIRLGVAMIEFDVAFSSDAKLVLMHDGTVDRTTDGTGPVSDLTLLELKKLDAGSWKGSQFANERIPTLEETLSIMPTNIWLNVHLKGTPELAAAVAAEMIETGRWNQAFLACGTEAARAARHVDKRIKICNMDRQANSLNYIRETIAMKAEFIQLLGGESVDPDHTALLKQHGIRINYCCANEASKIKSLFRSGVQFPLVDRVAAMLKVAEQSGVNRVGTQRLFRGPSQP